MHQYCCLNAHGCLNFRTDINQRVEQTIAIDAPDSTLLQSDLPFYTRIQLKRLSMHMTVSELADVTGISTKRLVALETKQVLPSDKEKSILLNMDPDTE